MPTALITGASAGLGQAMASELIARSWDVIVTARGEGALLRVATDLGPLAHPVAGDVADDAHHQALVDEVHRLGGLDLLMHNASTLGASPLPSVAELEPDTMTEIWKTNLAGPVQLTRALLPALRAAGGIVLAVSSDAAVENYPTWGGYGSSKAALDHLVLTLGAEEARVSTYAVDPGDMRTAMHQAAFPGEDISDRPGPETPVPGILALVQERPANGRYRAAEVAASLEAGRVAEVAR